jgi:hypothetical protein
VDTTLTEIEIDEVILAWDGRVVEVFGGRDARRWHVRRLTVKLEGPDKNGRYFLQLRGPNDDGSLVRAEGEQGPALLDLVARLEAAGATVRT